LRRRSLSGYIDNNKKILLGLSCTSKMSVQLIIKIIRLKCPLYAGFLLPAKNVIISALKPNTSIFA